MKRMKRLRRHHTFLNSILRKANAKLRQVMLEHANKGQIGCD